MEKILANALGDEAEKLGADEKRELLSRLLARLAHEIRNPLSSLDIHVQLLAEDLAVLPENVRQSASDRLDILRGEIHRLEGIVRQFISLAGPTELMLQPVELRGVLKHVHVLLEAEATQRQIELRLEQPAALPRIRADEGQLIQALVNLVINAIQAVGRKGGITLRVQMAPDGQWVVIEVEDSGPGMPPEALDTIFEPFFTTKKEGSGLGLWIVRQIVAAHGGMVRASNRTEGGARFEVRLPVRATEMNHG
jgi:two-component system sensor histidine kinase HydH